MKLYNTISMIVLLACFSRVSSQEDGISFVSVKGGAYNWLEEDAGYIGGLELGFSKNEKLYSVEYLYAQEFLEKNMSRPRELFSQLNFFFCESVGDNLFRFNYQIGASLIGGKKRGEPIDQAITPYYEYEEEDFFTIGLPVKFGLKYVPNNYVAIGLELQVNINYEKPLYMPMLCVEFW